MAALMPRAVFCDENGSGIPAVHWSGPSAGKAPRSGIGRESTPSTVTGEPPGGCRKQRPVGVGHGHTPLEHLVVLVHNYTHHRTDVEEVLALGVGRGGEDIADGSKVADRMMVG